MARILAALALAMAATAAKAQFNVERLIVSGQIALHYEDYALSIQYFNRAIALKPHLYQPWLSRGAAKFHLDDFIGAEADATEAIRLNPYIDNTYDLRAISKIRQGKHAEAIADYTAAIRLNPDSRGYRFNKAVCLMKTGDYRAAHREIDTIAAKWADYAYAYSLDAEVYLQEKDTANAARRLDKSLQTDPQNADAWTARAYISLARKEWRQADTLLGKAIHLRPANVANYVNRALARYSCNNLRGAMDDYDTALSLDPGNFLAHYNRGQLRMQLGDDNRAIEDFDYVIRMEPGNPLAIFNRAILLDRTGNLRAAIADYSEVIRQFPNFWTGLARRASCYRRLGMAAKAEMDEFRILKAQLDKRAGMHTAWSKGKREQVRKRSEIDMDKYDQLAVADENSVEHEYESEFRGRIQDRAAHEGNMPMFSLSPQPYSNGLKSYQAYDADLDKFNAANEGPPLYVNCNRGKLPEEASAAIFAAIDSLSSEISRDGVKPQPATLLKRAAAYCSVQDHPSALSDLGAALAAAPGLSLLYWQRGVARAMQAGYDKAEGRDVKIELAMAEEDLRKALELNPDNAYLHYNLGNTAAERGDTEKAVEEYGKALAIDPNLAEAYYNRGIAHMRKGEKEKAARDLGRAGELGLYQAYSLIKKVREKD